GCVVAESAAAALAAPGGSASVSPSERRPASVIAVRLAEVTFQNPVLTARARALDESRKHQKGSQHSPVLQRQKNTKISEAAENIYRVTKSGVETPGHQLSRL